MPDVSRRKLFAGLVTVPVASAVAAAYGENTAPAPMHKFAPRLSGREMLRKRYFPNFELVTQDGKKMKFYDDMLKDKIVVLNMMYADCEGVCPTITTSTNPILASAQPGLCSATCLSGCTNKRVCSRR